MTVPVVPAPIEPVVPEVVPTVAPQVEAKPPWGTPDEFNPEKAWDLITKLREQKNDPAVAKELSELRAAKQAADDATRTDVEKAQARADAAEKALAESVSLSLRSAIALEKGLTASQAKRLVGATREELEADATQLLADFPQVVVPAAPGADGQGNVGTPIAGPTQITSLEELDQMTPEAIVEAKKAGRLNSLMGITAAKA